MIVLELVRIGHDKPCFIKPSNNKWKYDVGRNVHSGHDSRGHGVPRVLLECVRVVCVYMSLYGSVTSVTSVRLCFAPRCDKNKTTSPGLVRQWRRNSIHSKIQSHRRHDPRPRLCEFRHVKHGFRDATDDDSHQDHSQKSADQSREHHFLDNECS